MHRHGYQGRKLHRERDQRRSLVKSLADSLVQHESIETTLPKAKEVVPYVEKLITKAKKGDLHNRRQIVSSLHTVESAHKLMDEIAPKLKGRTSGHLRVVKTRVRRGDHAQLARVSFVDDLKAAPVAKPVEAKKSGTPKPKTSAAKTIQPKTAVKPAAKKPGQAPTKAKEEPK